MRNSMWFGYFYKLHIILVKISDTWPVRHVRLLSLARCARCSSFFWADDPRVFTAELFFITGSCALGNDLSSNLNLIICNISEVVVKRGTPPAYRHYLKQVLNKNSPKVAALPVGKVVWGPFIFTLMQDRIIILSRGC